VNNLVQLWFGDRTANKSAKDDGLNNQLRWDQSWQYPRGSACRLGDFPIKFLGLPLSPRRLRKVDFQPQIDKAACKLSVWYGRNLKQAGRVYLTKSVLSSQSVYLLTVIKPPKEVLDDIGKIRRRFLWCALGGTWKVNRITATLPKE
jgi:hypothetical protein